MERCGQVVHCGVQAAAVSVYAVLPWSEVSTKRENAFVEILMCVFTLVTVWSLVAGFRLSASQTRICLTLILHTYWIGVFDSVMCTAVRSGKLMMLTVVLYLLLLLLQFKALTCYIPVVQN